MTRSVEIRSYNLRPGTRPAFHEKMLQEALPMLRRWKVDVVSFGPSPHDEDGYYLIRAYKNLADREQSQDAFYGSTEWITGPRSGILELIENFTSVVLNLEDSLVDCLRT